MTDASPTAVHSAAELEALDIRKAFDAVQALRGVSLSIRPGEARGLIGENGAGKSTLINVICGALQPDGGVVKVRGRVASLKNPHAALALGIGTVHQQTRLAPNLTALQNVQLGDEPTVTVARWLRRAPRPDAVAALEFVGLSHAANTLVERLRLADRQLVSVARAVSRGDRLLIFDEPTAALSPVETERLMGVIDRLRAQGTALLYVTHRLHELGHVVDEITVMRDGQVVGHRPSDAPEADLVDLMAGGAVLEHEQQTVVERRRRTAAHRGETGALLTVRELSTAGGAVRGVDFDVHRGEVVGLVGLPDSGAAELVQVLAGARSAATGCISLDGRRAKYRTPRQALRRGIGYLAGDRALKGVIPNASLAETITVSTLPQSTVGGLRRPRRETAMVRTLAAQCQVRAASTHSSITALSGGNQQKALFARVLAARPRIIVCEDATTGVDVAGREAIYELAGQWCEQGNAIVWNTSDLRELVTLCDRVLVLRHGAIVAELARTELSVRSLMVAQFGGRDLASESDRLQVHHSAAAGARTPPIDA